MRFRDYFSLKQILFAIVVISLMLLFAFRQSNNMVKVSFGESEVQAVSAKYSMAIPYDIIESVELAALPEAGEEIAECYEDDIIRTGYWKNAVWGEHYIVADLDPTNCIVVHLNDGRIFVFNRKDNAETAEIYETLLTYLPNA